VLDDVYGKRRIPLPGGDSAAMDVYIPREEGDLLYSLVRASRPNLTVEVGMANGLSTLFIAQALKDNGHGTHVAIDPFQSTDWKGAGLELLRKAGLVDRVELIEKPSHQALPELEQAGRTAEFVLIDGSHMFDYVIADFVCSDRLLAVGGLMAFDDSDWAAIRSAIRYILANRRYELAPTNVVIEPPPGRPSRLGAIARRVCGRLPVARGWFRPDFLAPSRFLREHGRCTVLRKLGPDDRDSQSFFHHDF
jgi:predicted O-methyltransferase YrrM